MQPLRVLTWHVHGNYLLYLSQANVDFYLPTKHGRNDGYGGRGSTFAFGPNVHDVPVEEVRGLEFDCILFQTRKNYLVDQYEILSAEQRRLPRLYLEHDPPLEHPSDARHWVNNPDILLVHVTPFNALMWDCGRTPTRVIDHGVSVPEGVRYRGELERGIVVVNHLKKRGRRLGADLFEQVREEIPLDLVGMGAEELDGLGEIFPPRLPLFESRYRFFFHPIRWTSLGLALIEAMMIGLPIVGVAATELSTVIQNGVSGFIDTDVSKLIEPMRGLLRDRDAAQEMGENARRYALERFGIERFAREWEETFAEVVGGYHAGRLAGATVAAAPPGAALEGGIA